MSLLHDLCVKILDNLCYHTAIIVEAGVPKVGVALGKKRVIDIPSESETRVAAEAERVKVSRYEQRGNVHGRRASPTYNSYKPELSSTS